LCKPRTFSTSGKEPCMSCDTESYQDISGQASCKKCPAGLSTGFWGAKESSSCQDVKTCEILKPCAEGSTYVNVGSTYMCACPEGLVGPNCENNIDDCAEDLCLNGGGCIDGLKNYTCSCPPDFTGSNCEVNINDCDSTTGFTGKSCELIQKPCSRNSCEHQGTFLAKGDEYECTCLEGFTGPRCEENVDDCHSSPCLNGGTCFDVVASFSWKCSGLYTGKLCETVKPSNFSPHFPDASVSNYARISVKRNLRAITLSFFMKTSQSKERGTPVSYAFADPETGAIVDNGLVISDSNKLLLYISQESYDTNTVANDNDWHHCAVMWNSKTGQWTFYWDAQSRITGVRSMGGHMFKGELVVGQEHDQVGGAFSGIESYSGYVAELNMWDYEMSASEINSLTTSCGNSGNVVACPELRNGIEGKMFSSGYPDICTGPPSCQLLPNKTLTTFDGLSLPVHDRRRYSLFQDCYDGDYFGYLDETGYQRAVQVYIHCMTATMYLNGTVLVNDKTVSLPHQQSTILKVSSSTHGAGVQLQTHHGVVVSVKSDGTIVTTIAKKFVGKDSAAT
ncbi:hypothetical protein HPB47_016166, partial [Ixodes persulcatus]